MDFEKMPQSPWQRLSCQMIRSSVNRPRNDAEKFKPPAKKKANLPAV